LGPGVGQLANRLVEVSYIFVRKQRIDNNRWYFDFMQWDRADNQVDVLGYATLQITG
jgi:hypothetical protein